MKREIIRIDDAANSFRQTQNWISLVRSFTWTQTERAGCEQWAQFALITNGGLFFEFVAVDSMAPCIKLIYTRSLLNDYLHYAVM